jgi:tRNA threonylcarbamoyl adenosine modification protein YeaZ
VACERTGCGWGVLNFLTLDTSQGSTSLALWREGACAGEVFYPAAQSQAALLVQQIEEITHGHTLNGIACITGIGGFTSMRIGVATARGLGFAAGIPVWGVSLLHIMAWVALKHHASVTCILPAGVRDRAMQSFDTDPHGLPLPRSGLVVEAQDAALPTEIPVFTLTEYEHAKTAYYLGEWLHHLRTHGDATAYLNPIPLYAKPADAAIGRPLLIS